MVDPRCVRTISALFLITTGFAASPAAAQDWPSRPMTMVISFAAGSPIDVAGRIMAARMSELLGQQVIVENIAGSGGMTGAARVAKAPPDGYQIMFGGTATHAYNQTVFRTPLYDAAADFVPVALVAETPSVLVAFKGLPINNFQEFVAHAKANQASMQYGSVGVSSASHLACALLNAKIGINVTHVPYRGGTQSMQDVIAGRLDYSCPLGASAIPQIQGKTVKPLAILAKKRWAVFPDLPSINELGLADFDASSWYAIYLPKGTPAPIVQKLHAAAVAAMETPIVQQRMKEAAAELVSPERRSADYLAKFTVSEIARWGTAIKAANIERD
jgi:tripartite-type tricarboxylate transporter receptor subunit TctC